MTENYPLISIITLNWNTAELTGDFLKSIINTCTYPNYEIIIVDNASKNDPTVYFQAITSSVCIIRNNENLGFSGGNNIGIKQAKGDYYFIVNNDTEFTPRLLESLLSVFIDHPDAGLVSPKINSFYDKRVIEYAGYKKVNVFTGRNGMVGFKEIDHNQYNQLEETHYAHGAAMMISKKVVEKVGLMPEIFFLYYEELDWSEQIKRNNYKVYFQPEALIYHKESMTTGKESPLKTYYLNRNRILFMQRNMPLYNYIVFIGYLILFTIPKNTIIFLFKGQKEHLKAFWKGIFWHLGNARKKMVVSIFKIKENSLKAA